MFLLRFRYDLVTFAFYDLFFGGIVFWIRFGYGFLMPLEVSNFTYAGPFGLQNMGVELDLCSAMLLS